MFQKRSKVEETVTKKADTQLLGPVTAPGQMLGRETRKGGETGRRREPCREKENHRGGVVSSGRLGLLCLKEQLHTRIV